MSDTDELRREANSKASQKYQKEQERRALDDQIERLRTVQNQLATEKATVQRLKDDVRRREDPDEAWAGQKRNQFHDYTRNDLRRYYDSYYEQTDAMLDAVIHKIAELENQSSDLGGVIGWLASAINSLWADIRSAVN